MQDRNTYRSCEKLETLHDVKVRVRENNAAGLFPGQSDELVVDHIERETFPRVSFIVRLEEVVSPSEEIPSVVELDAR